MNFVTSWKKSKLSEKLKILTAYGTIRTQICECILIEVRTEPAKTKWIYRTPVLEFYNNLWGPRIGSEQE
jgi:hypothetical protein